MTYGILLDCCINADDMGRAQRVFEAMRQAQSTQDDEDGDDSEKRHLGLNTVAVEPFLAIVFSLPPYR